MSHSSLKHRVVSTTINHHHETPSGLHEDCHRKHTASSSGRTPIITYQRRKHRRLNKRKLIGLPEGTTNDSCQEERVEPQS